MKMFRLSAILVAALLALAACQPGGGGGGATDVAGTDAAETADGGESPGATEGGGGTGTAADCDADEFGCVEYAEGEPIRL